MDKSKKIRLDNLVASKFKISRAVAKKYILNGFIYSNNEKLLKPNLFLDESIEIDLIKNDLENQKEVTSIKKWDFDLEIVYEDEYILVVNKPSGIIVHPTNFEQQYTLANILKSIFEKKNIDFFGDYSRNGIVHRLDKDTSGLLIVAKNIDVYNCFIDLIKNKKVKRKYVALIKGSLKSKTIKIDAPIIRINNSNKRIVSNESDAIDAITIFKELKKFDNFSLVECELITGRTHQIRVHAQYLNNNILNDPLYGDNYKKTTKYGQYLTAYKLSFKHPFLNNKLIDIKIDIPIEFMNFIKNMK